MRDAHRELGKIVSVRADHWREETGEPNTVWVQVDFHDGGSSQGFGGLNLDAKGIAAFIAGVCEACGVRDRERLVGREVYALRAFSSWNEPIVGLEDKETGRRFTVRAFRRAMGFPGVEDESVYDYELKKLDRTIEHLQRRLAEERNRMANLRSDYAEWD